MRHEAAIGPAEARHYRLYVPGGGLLGGRTGVRVTLTALSGTVTMYMDAHSRRPNATASVWRSEPSVGGASTLEVPADDPALQACSPSSLRRPTNLRRGPH